MEEEDVQRAEVIGLRCYKKVANEGAPALLCNIMIMRSSSTRNPCTISHWPMSLLVYALSHLSCLTVFFFFFLACLMSRGANFIKPMQCKSEIKLSAHIKEDMNKNMSRKRLNGAPHMTVMASASSTIAYF